MTKVIAILAIFSGLTGVGATGLYFWSTAPEEEVQEVLAPTVDGFRDGGNYKCLELFHNLHLTLEETSVGGKVFTPREITNKTPLELTFFGTPSRRQTPKSCLMVSWDRENYLDNRWSGSFRWLWTFVHGSRGFLMFTAAETSEAKNQLNLFGGIYFLKKDKGNWLVNKYRELKSTPTNERKMDVTDFERKFPSVGSAISKDNSWGERKDNWGFIKDKNELENVCKGDGKCSLNKLISKDHFTGRWEWESKRSESGKIQDWTSNSPDQLMLQIYPEITNVKTVLNNGFKEVKGKWK